MAEHGGHITQCWSGRLQARKGGGYNGPDGNGYSWRHQYELMLDLTWIQIATCRNTYRYVNVMS